MGARSCERAMQGYDFTRAQLPALLSLKFLPEQPPEESAVLLAWLAEHGPEYDRFSFSVRVGQGQAPDPNFLPGVQRSQAFSTKKRIDALAWQGSAITLVEAKRRVSADALGKCLMYRQLLLEELPDAAEPRLVVVGLYGDADVIRVLNGHGIDVLLYETAIAR